MELKGEGEGGREGVHGGVGDEDYTSCIWEMGTQCPCWVPTFVGHLLDNAYLIQIKIS